MKTKTKQGFTLIELIVVVTIISVLMAVGVTSYVSVNKKSRDAKRKSDIEQIRSALEMYRSDNASYPSGTLDSSLVDTYMPSIPKDPKNQTYLYTPSTCASGVCYGYTLEGTLEAYAVTVKSPDSTCDPDLSTHNYCVKNP